MCPMYVQAALRCGKKRKKQTRSLVSKYYDVYSWTPKPRSYSTWKVTHNNERRTSENQIRKRNKQRPPKNNKKKSVLATDIEIHSWNSFVFHALLYLLLSHRSFLSFFFFTDRLLTHYERRVYCVYLPAIYTAWRMECIGNWYTYYGTMIFDIYL